MASALTMATFDALTKEYYTNERIYNATYQNRPFYALVKKDTSFGGRNMPVPIIIEDAQSRSADFTQALARSTESSVIPEAFDITPVKDYGIGTVDNLTLESTKSDKHAHMAALKTAMDSSQNGLANSLAMSITRDKDGSIGQVNATPANGATFTLNMKYESDITTISVGSIVNIYSAKTGGSLRISETGTSDFPVTSVNRSDGTFVIGAAHDGNSTIAANDFIFHKGDRGGRISGLAAWIPYDAPDATPFFGVDRTIDTTRLSGIRYDGTSDNYEQALLKLLSKIAREGSGAPDCILMNYENFMDLILVLGSRVQYINISAPFVQAGFHGVQIIGPSGAVKVMADPFMTQNYAYALTMSTWKLWTIGEAIKLSDTDGNKLLRQDTSDGLQFRYRFYGQMACYLPSGNGVVKLRD